MPLDQLSQHWGTRAAEVHENKSLSCDCRSLLHVPPFLIVLRENRVGHQDNHGGEERAHQRYDQDNLSMVEKSTPTLRVKPKMAQAMSPEQEALQLADEQLLKSIDAGDVAAVEGSDRSGADVNVADESQNSAVHKAARCDDLRVIKFLLSRGAHPAFLDNEGNQPAAVAIKFNNIGALNELLKVTGEDGQRVVDPLHVNPMTGNTLMHEAAWFGRDDCLKILLNTGAFTRDVLDQRNGKGGAVARPR